MEGTLPELPAIMQPRKRSVNDLNFIGFGLKEGIREVPGVHLYLQRCHSPDVWTRTEAVTCIGKLPQKDLAKCADQLFRMLYDKDTGVRINVLCSLCNLEMESLGHHADTFTEMVLPVLVAMLHDVNDTIREWTLKLLMRVEPQYAITSKTKGGCLEVIFTLLEDDDASVRALSLSVLGTMTPSQLGLPETKQAILDMLSDPTAVVRLAALETISKLHPQQALHCADRFVAMLQDPKPIVRTNIVRVIKRLDPRTQTRCLFQMLRVLHEGSTTGVQKKRHKKREQHYGSTPLPPNSVEVQKSTLRAIRKLPAEIQMKCSDAIFKQLATANPRQREMAFKILHALAPEAQVQCQGHIAQGLQHIDPAARDAVLGALSAVQSDAQIAVVDEIFAQLKHADRGMRNTALKALDSLDLVVQSEARQHVALALQEAKERHEIPLETIAKMPHWTDAGWDGHHTARTTLRRSKLRLLRKLGTIKFTPGVMKWFYVDKVLSEYVLSWLCTHALKVAQEGFTVTQHAIPHKLQIPISKEEVNRTHVHINTLPAHDPPKPRRAGEYDDEYDEYGDEYDDEYGEYGEDGEQQADGDGDGEEVTDGTIASTTRVERITTVFFFDEE